MIGAKKGLQVAKTVSYELSIFVIVLPNVDFNISTG